MKTFEDCYQQNLSQWRRRGEKIPLRPFGICNIVISNTCVAISTLNISQHLSKISWNLKLWGRHFSISNIPYAWFAIPQSIRNKWKIFPKLSPDLAEVKLNLSNVLKKCKISNKTIDVSHVNHSSQQKVQSRSNLHHPISSHDECHVRCSW